MTILQVNKFYRKAGGAEVYLKAIERYLRHEGHRVIPFAMVDSRNDDSAYARFFTPAVNFRELSNPRNALRMGAMFWSAAAARHMRALLEHLDSSGHTPQVAHIHNLYHQLTPSVLPPLREAGIPIVMTLHDMHFFGTAYAESAIEAALCSVELALHRRLRVFQKYVDIVIAPSRFAQKQLIRWGFPGERIRYIHHAVEALPKPAGHTEHRPFLHLVFVGRLAHEKGIKHLLEALTMVPEFVTATIVGEGPLKGELVKLSGLLGLKKRVEFVGYKKGAALSGEIVKGQATVVPSSVPEVFGLTMVEAFSLMRPVLAFNHGAAPEIITHGKTGWLVEPTSEALARGIREIMHSRRKLPAMGRAAHAELAKYRYADYMPKLLEVYETATPHRRSGTDPASLGTDPGTDPAKLGTDPAKLGTDPAKPIRS